MDHSLLSKKQLLQLREAAAGRKAVSGARGLVRDIMRLDDGTFAPKGRGRFLKPGQEVRVPRTDGKGGFVRGKVDAGGAVDLLDGPDAGTKIKVVPSSPQTPGGTAITKDGKIGINRDPGAELAKPKPPRTPGRLGGDDAEVARGAKAAPQTAGSGRMSKKEISSLVDSYVENGSINVWGFERLQTKIADTLADPDSDDIYPLDNPAAIEAVDTAFDDIIKRGLVDPDDLPSFLDDLGVGSSFSQKDVDNYVKKFGKAEPETPGVPGSGDGFVDNAEAPDPTSIKDLPIGTEFKLKNGDTYVVHKHTGAGAVGKVVKLSDGTTTGKAKFFNGMLAPKQVKIPDGAEAPKPKKPKAPGGLNLKNAGPSGKPRNVKAMSDSKLLQLAKHPDVEPDLLDRVEAELTKRGKEMPSQKLGKPGMFNAEPTGDALDSAISKKKGGKGGSPYENRVREFEDMGMTTSDAQSAADVEVYDGKLKGDAFHDFIKGQQDSPAMASASVSAMSYADIPSLKKGTKLNLENTGPSGKLRNIKAMQPAKLKALIEHPDVDPELRNRARKQLAAKGYDVPGAGGAGVPKQPAMSGSSSEHDFGSPEANAILEPLHSMFKGSGLGEGSPSGSHADKFVANYDYALALAKNLDNEEQLKLKNKGGTFSIAKRSEAGVDEYSIVKNDDGMAAIDPESGESMVYDSPEIAAAHAIVAEWSVGGPNEPTSDPAGADYPSRPNDSGTPNELKKMFVDDIQKSLSNDDGFTTYDFDSLAEDVIAEVGDELDQDGNPLWGEIIDDVLEDVIKKGFVKPENLDELLQEVYPGSGKAAVAERKRLSNIASKAGNTKTASAPDAPSGVPQGVDAKRIAKAWEAYSGKLEEFKFFDDMGNKKERARKAAQVRAAKGRFIKAGGDIDNPPNVKAAPQTPGQGKNKPDVSQWVDDIESGLSSDEGFTDEDFRALEMDIMVEFKDADTGEDQLDADGVPLWEETADATLEEVIKRGFVKPENLDNLLTMVYPGEGKAAVAERKRLKKLAGSPAAGKSKTLNAKQAAKDWTSSLPVGADAQKIIDAWKTYTDLDDRFNFGNYGANYRRATPHSTLIGKSGPEGEKARKALAKVKAAKLAYRKLGGKVNNPPVWRDNLGNPRKIELEEGIGPRGRVNQSERTSAKRPQIRLS
jgi:hypothetical protein